MKYLLLFGNAIFSFLAISIVWNSLIYFFTNIFYEPTSILQRIVLMSSIVILNILFLFLRRITIKHSWEGYIKFRLNFKAIVFVAMIIWQLLLLVSMPIIPLADPNVIYRLAIGDTGKDIIDYISINPNNYMLLLFEKILMIFFGTKYLIHGFILCNIVFVDSSIIILTRLAKKIMPSASNILYYILVFFVGFSPQFLQAYTDIPAFFLGTIVLFLGYQLFDQKSWLNQIFLSIAFGVVLAISYNMRAPLMIYMIAGILVGLFKLLQRDIQLSIKKVMLVGLTAISFLMIHFAGQHSMYQQYFVPYEEGRSRTMLYFIDLGLTSTGAAHAELSEEVLAASGSERNTVFLNSIKNRISKMSILDWCKHLSNKFYLISAEGMMGWQTEAILQEDNLIINRFSDTKLAIRLRNWILVNFREYYQYSLFFQVMWIFIALGIVLYCLNFKCNTDSFHLWAQLTLFGGLLFLLIFEGGRSRYLIQFLPVIIWISAAGFSSVFKIFANKLKTVNILQSKG